MTEQNYHDRAVKFTRKLSYNIDVTNITREGSKAIQTTTGLFLSLQATAIQKIFKLKPSLSIFAPGTVTSHMISIQSHMTSVNQSVFTTMFFVQLSVNQGTLESESKYSLHILCEGNVYIFFY